MREVLAGTKAGPTGDEGPVPEWRKRGGSDRTRPMSFLRFLAQRWQSLGTGLALVGLAVTGPQQRPWGPLTACWWTGGARARMAAHGRHSVVSRTAFAPILTRPDRNARKSLEAPCGPCGGMAGKAGHDRDGARRNREYIPMNKPDDRASGMSQTPKSSGE